MSCASVTLLVSYEKAPELSLMCLSYLVFCSASPLSIKNNDTEIEWTANVYFNYYKVYYNYNNLKHSIILGKEEKLPGILKPGSLSLTLFFHLQ